MLLKGMDKKTKKEPEWIKLNHTLKKAQKNDILVLGHAEIRLPPIISSSSVKGVKARLVKAKSAVLKAPPKAEEPKVEVITEWEFDENNQTKPIYFNGQQELTQDFWVEMQNPTNEDAVVNASIHCMVRSKSL